MKRVLLLPILLLAVGCESTPVETGDDSPTPTLTPAPQISSVTWHQDVKPIIDRVCSRCHYEGGVASVPFTSYEATAPYAPLMASYTAAGMMPPPVADPGCRDYKDSEHMFISEQERSVFTAWADAGAPEGNPTTVEDVPPVVTHLEDLDLKLLPPHPHAPSFDTSDNEYYCFILPTGRDETFYITAFDPLIDRVDMVHHIVLYLDVDGTAGSDEVQPDGGFNCENTSANVQMLTAWAPGMSPLELPEGTGMPVQPGQRLILQMHYFKGANVQLGDTDQSGYALRTAPTIDQQMIFLSFGPTDFTIPASAQAYTATETYKMGGELPNLKVWGAFPHMHGLGSSYQYGITTRGGEEACLLDGRYDYHNQLTYMFKDPFILRQGDTVHMSCTWDNTAASPYQLNHPPKDVSYGQGTNDEMCFVFSYVTIATPATSD